MKTEEQKPFRLRRKAPPGYMSIAQAAEYLGVSRRTVQRYIKDHGLPCYKIGRRVLINRGELNDWVKENGSQ